MTVLENDVKPVRKLKRPNKENYSSGTSSSGSIAGGRSSSSQEGGPPSSKRPLLDMLNGYRGSSDGGHHHHHHHHQRGNNGDAPPESPVATLSNMGNTCFLNSVLYTLRFAPTFLHNLHHLYGELCYMSGRTNQNKAKTSSLGRNIGALSGGPSSRSTSSKDLLSLGAAAAAAATTSSSSSSSTTTSSNSSSSVIINNDLFPKSKVQIVTEKLHELFITMHNLEMKESTEPYQPNALLQAIREANYIFEGNHQQDAHELLVYVLDNIRDTCDLLTQQVTQNPIWLADTPETTASSNNSGGGGGIGNFWSVRRSWTKKPGKKKERAAAEAARLAAAAVQSSSASINSSKEPLIGDLSEVNEDDPVENGTSSLSSTKKTTSVNFVAEDFEGITLRRTTCLECECVTERKEPFYDIPVPIPISESEFDASINQPSEVFKKLCVTSEKLCDSNKYLCETCMRYNEARREVLFEKLPNLMVLQLKRFTTSSGGNLQKVNTYMPTPLELECFCETCCDEETPPPHRYQLCCVIMHLGGTMASGHYITYVKASEHYEDYAECTRNLYRNAQQHHGGGVGGGAGGGSLSASNSEKSLNILKYFKPRTLAGFDSKLQSSSKNNLLMNGVKMCRSVDCCTVKLNKNVMENSINSLAKKGSSNSNNDYWNGHNGGGAAATDDIWLECDDENVQAITSQALEEELSYKPNSTSTPYLLFYTKIRDSSVD